MNRVFYILFHTKSKIWGIFYNYSTSHFRLITFQVLNSHMWLLGPYLEEQMQATFILSLRNLILVFGFSFSFSNPFWSQFIPNYVLVQMAIEYICTANIMLSCALQRALHITDVQKRIFWYINSWISWTFVCVILLRSFFVSSLYLILVPPKVYSKQDNQVSPIGPLLLNTKL
jgi:hypothetical protein